MIKIFTHKKFLAAYSGILTVVFAAIIALASGKKIMRIRQRQPYFS